VSIDVRALTDGDDLETELDLARRAFGPFGGAERERRLAGVRMMVGAGRHLAAFDGSRQVASAAYFDMRQWWRGRSLPMAGVAGVKVAPEEQGRGVGRSLMTGLLEQIAARGYPLSVLYPATTAIYRSLGWEIAGGQYQVTVPARSLRSLQPPDPQTDPQAGRPAEASAGPGGEAARSGGDAAGRDGAVAGPGPGRPAIRRAGPADAAEMLAVEGELHAAARDCGPVTFDAETLTGLLDDPDIYCFLAPDGLLAYAWNRGSDEMRVYVLAAGSAETARALWSIVGSHGTMVQSVRAFVSPADPVSWLVREPGVTLARHETWMLRLVDAPAAIAGRGFPGGAALAVPLTLRDAQLPANTGQWLLEVNGGKSALTRAEADAGRPGSPAPPLRLGARGLAAMYAGTPLATLRSAGLAAGGSSGADAALDEAFAGTAYMFDYF
jgi:predicted N-acetyltransferase YhbS